MGLAKKEVDIRGLRVVFSAVVCFGQVCGVSGSAGGPIRCGT